MIRDEKRIANAIPYVRIARRRLRDYHQRGSFVTPDELYRVQRLCELALDCLRASHEWPAGEAVPEPSTVEGGDG